MATGRPTDYTPEIAAEICERVAVGESMRSIGRDESMPAISTMFLWISKHPEFSEQYAIAKDQSCIALADEIMDIADNGSNDYMEKLSENGGCEGYRVNGEAINRSRLRVDARKWILAKQMPKKYGDRQVIDLNKSYADMDNQELENRLKVLEQQLEQSLKD